MRQVLILDILKRIDCPDDIYSITKYDWIGLIRWFEKNRRTRDDKAILPYLSEERQANNLRKLCEECWSFAIDAILHAADNRYQGYGDGGSLYFKAEIDDYKARELLGDR